MLQKRRVFDITNLIMNYVFLVFVLLCCIYFASFWFELRMEFLTFMVGFVNFFAWVLAGVSVLLFILALVLALSEKDFRIGALVWCLLRMIICAGLAVAIDVFDILEKGGISLTL